MKRVDFFIAKKYLKNDKNKNIYYSKISIIIGFFIYIIINALINGFNSKIENSLLKTIPSITYESETDKLYERYYLDKLNENKEIEHFNSYTNIFGVIKEKQKELNIKGIGKINEYLLEKNCIDRFEEKNSVCLSKKLAKELNLNINEEFNLTTYSNKTIKNIKFKYVGNLKVDTAFYNYMIISNEKNIKNILNKDTSTGIEVYLKKPLEIDSFLEDKQIIFYQTVYIKTWKSKLSRVYEDLNVIKLLSIFILIFIMLLSILNMIFNIIIKINEKKKELILLRNIGFSKNKIRNIFLLQTVYVYIKSVIISLLLSVIAIFFFIDLVNYLNIDISNGYYTFSELPITIDYKGTLKAMLLVGLLYTSIAYCYLRKIKII